MIKILLWLTKRHKWHKDWLGCWICEARLKNNPDKPTNNKMDAFNTINKE